MIPKIVPVTEFRTKVLEAVRKAQNAGQEYVITAKGKPAAVLMNFEEWESLLETLEIKQDKKLMEAIQKGKKYFKKNRMKAKSHKEINWN
ncbi:MAG: hypothetical protein A3H42_02220 [Deltaproteobacteria bacterium RIFCSPLOWO2_02_FULL_46_8]|nr:MAG: hypothetical protein A3H42_02220 [Deltaproteobacteria bacterium RIFCSPLOWO2_02_FULL_46_8]